MQIISRRIVIKGVAASAILAPIRSNSLHAEIVTLTAVASFVALALAQGAISYVGGRLMGDILGDPKIGDIKTWIANAIRELEGYFRAELQRQLEQQVIDEITADAQGISTNLYEYALLSEKSRRSNRFLIEYTDLTTAHLIPLAMKHEPVTFITMSAMSYRLMSIYSLYLLDKDAGHILSNKPMMDDYVISIVSFRNYADKILSPDTRVGGYACDYIGGKGEEGTGGYARCSIFLDDKIQGTYLGATFDAAEKKASIPYAALSAEIKRQQREFIDKINKPLLLTIEGYDLMCRKVGSKYVPPVPV